MTLPNNHLRFCDKHGVVQHGQDERNLCPVCETDAEAKPGKAHNQRFTQTDLRWQIDHTVMIELLDLLVDWLEDEGEDPPWVAVAEIPEKERAAGYTRQEVWFNVVQFEFDNLVRTIKQNEGAKEAIEALEAGEPLVEKAEFDHDRLDPEWWREEVEEWDASVEFEQPDEDTLIMEISGFGSDDHYSQVREWLGHRAKEKRLDIYTLEAGGLWEEARIRLKR